MSQIVRVKREVLMACMMCSLCKKLLRDATTISECLHTFCRKCIFERLADDEEDECCPVCQIDLGCVPVEKLRPDHNLEDIRAKIFPYKRKKVQGPEVIPSITFPVRRKERSLSSLGVITPRIGTQSGLTGKRTKAVARRGSAAPGASPANSEQKKKEDDNDDLLNSSSTEKFIKTTHSRRQTPSCTEASAYSHNKDTDDGLEISMYKSELWKPLNCLVEAANRTKVFKSNGETPAIKDDQTNCLENESDTYKTKAHPRKLKRKDYEKSNASTSPAMAKARRVHDVSRKRRGNGLSAQEVLDASDAACERRFCPVWLSLLSSSNKKGDAPLPQLRASYLRIIEGNLPVSFLQKYLVKKLNLSSEAEVEIACRGEPVSPMLSLYDLTEQWLRYGPSPRMQASVGSSAKDFVMVLTYSRKVESPSPFF